MNKLQLLTDRIRVLVPAIKELKFGCHIDNDIVSLDIIGRDITLADVLLVIGNEPCVMDDDNEVCNVCVEAYDGNFVWYKVRKPQEGTFETDVYWNLTKNALHEQDEETIDFLYSIICK